MRSQALSTGVAPEEQVSFTEASPWLQPPLGMGKQLPAQGGWGPEGALTNPRESGEGLWKGRDLRWNGREKDG